MNAMAKTNIMAVWNAPNEDFTGDANEQLVFTSIDNTPIGGTTDATVANGTERENV